MNHKHTYQLDKLYIIMMKLIFINAMPMKNNITHNRCHHYVPPLLSDPRDDHHHEIKC